MLPPIGRDPVLIVPQGQLADVSPDSTGTYYEFRLAVTKYMPTARVSTSSVLLLGLNITLPDVAIAPQAKRAHNANKRLILQALISEWPTETSLRWMVRARQKYSLVVICVYNLCIYYTFGMHRWCRVTCR